MSTLSFDLKGIHALKLFPASAKKYSMEGAPVYYTGNGKRFAVS